MQKGSGGSSGKMAEERRELYGYGIMLLQHNDDGFSLFTHRGVGLGSIGCIYKDDSGYIWVSGNNVVKKLNLSLE